MMGERWLTAAEFYAQFMADDRSTRIWRNQGMPYRKTADGAYLYPKEACHQWHRGEDGQKGDKDAEEEKVHFYQRKVPVL